MIKREIILLILCLFYIECRYLNLENNSSFKKINDSTYLIGKHEVDMFFDWKMNVNLSKYFEPINKLFGMDFIECEPEDCLVSNPIIDLQIISEFQDLDNGEAKKLFDYVIDPEENIIYYLVEDGIRMIQLEDDDGKLSIKHDLGYFFLNSAHSYLSMYHVTFECGSKIMIIYGDEGLFFSPPILDNRTIQSLYIINDPYHFDINMNMQEYKDYLLIPNKELGLRIYHYSKNKLKLFTTLFSSSSTDEHNISSILIPNKNDSYILVADELKGLLLCNFTITSDNFTIDIIEEIKILGIKSIQSSSEFKPNIITILSENNGKHAYYELLFNSNNKKLVIIKMEPLSGTAESLITVGHYSAITMENLLTVIKVGSDISHRYVTIPLVYDSTIFSYNNFYYMLVMTGFSFKLTKIHSTDPFLEVPSNFNDSISYNISDYSHICLESEDLSNVSLIYKSKGYCQYYVEIIVSKYSYVMQMFYLKVISFSILVVFVISLAIFSAIYFIIKKYKKTQIEYDKLKNLSQRIDDQIQEGHLDSGKKITLEK